MSRSANKSKEAKARPNRAQRKKEEEEEKAKGHCTGMDLKLVGGTRMSVHLAKPEYYAI